MYNDLGKVSKIVVLSTFSQPKYLSEISKIWFGNQTRYYRSNYTKQVDNGVKEGFIVRHKDNKYAANTTKILKETIKSINFDLKEKKSKEYLAKYLKKLEHFYIDLGEFTVRTYLNLDLIKTISNDDPNAAAACDLRFLFQLPFVIRYIEFKHKPVFSLLSQFLNWEKYYKLVIQLERENMHILEKNKLDLEWANIYRYVINSYYTQFVKEDSSLFQGYLKSLILKGGGEND